MGIAGWSIPKSQGALTAGDGSHLERYSRVFNSVEINSSFYRAHQQKTYERWAAAVPSDFRFSVKVPRTVTHEAGLRACRAEVDAFLAQVSGLGSKLAVLLVQLPPSLEFHAAIARRFFSQLCAASPARVVCEPRHATWFGTAADNAFNQWNVARVSADPSPIGTEPPLAGPDDIVYVRLHGSPRMYYSAYSTEFLQALKVKLAHLAQAGREVWCIFDNTAAYAAWGNALELK